MAKMRKRSVRIARHNTSISLESEFWDELKRIAASQKCSLNQLVAKIDTGRAGNLSSALRLFVLKELKKERHPGHVLRSQVRSGVQRAFPQQ